MYTIRVTEEQIKNMLSMLDRELKAGGLSALPAVVELHNVIATAVPDEVPVVSSTSQSDETPQGT